ncbi:transporter associated domain-containing protein [Silanimonas sp.]|uniref:HlyC/CorC family transporter n=1 Tax=Silanimonas sp. TaxID=1929290 RepID=UPI001BBE37B9|nr:transporter associated domain-containing protein [Silanimonas sp.]MBS3897064.1 CBS domain-containing protein [Silanimonas sp.]MBS3923986.1 CBS domain-containing protein [Xanthomonadaceae bacterium]
MSEDDPSPLPEKRSWLDRLSHAFSGEPETREDLVEILRDARSNRIIEGDTLRMLEGALAVSSMTVADVMVPRAQMVSLPGQAPLLDLMRAVVESGHSRFPVHGEDRDEVLGILLAKDLLRGIVADNAIGDVRELLRPAVLVPESKRLDMLLREFRSQRQHMAIVVDEHGGVAGLVTIEDVLEEIVGEIDDEHDDETPAGGAIAAQEDGRYVVPALMPIPDFNARFDARLPDDEFDTLGGLVTAGIGHLPEPGELLRVGRFEFTVIEADQRRLRTLGVTLHAQE